MANPRRSSFSLNPQNPENPFQSLQMHPQTPSLSSIIFFLKKPHAFPFLLSIFVLLTWVSLRFQHSTHFSSPPQLQQSHDDDSKVNLVRFSASFPSRIAKDKRGWLMDPVALANDVGISGGAVSCASVHIGEIRPGGMRGNHRHHTSNETFVIWGATTKFRLENDHVVGVGYAEVIIAENEVAVAASQSGTAHALLNLDPLRSTYFIGCQDSVVDYNNTTTDFNVWKDL